MRDIVHHQKYVQKKILKQARDEGALRNFEKTSSEPKQELSGEEFERFDPHHRKPRILHRINYH